jgi:hypothetical protein
MKMSEVRTVRDIEIDIAWAQNELDDIQNGDLLGLGMVRKRRKELQNLVKSLFKERNVLKKSS